MNTVLKETVMEQKEPLVFVDPNKPLSVGTFVRWLDEHFNPHTERDICQSKKIDTINIALINMKHKVEGMWEVMQKIDTILSVGKWTWYALASVATVVAALVVIASHLGWMK
jgi:hypothetical protein